MRKQARTKKAIGANDGLIRGFGNGLYKQEKENQFDMTILTEMQGNMQGKRNLKDAALWYARRGIRVHPLHDAGTQRAKEPRLNAWQEQASSDESVVGSWWEQWPNANIGIATGDAVDVLDLDGDEAMQLFADCPETPHVRTFKGVHVYFASGGLRNGVNVHPMVKGVDLRGERGYVVAPPSVHPSGFVYEWAVSPADKAFAALPMWVKALNAKKQEPVKIQFDMPVNMNVSDAQRSGYAEKAIEGIKEDMRNLIGGGRNQTLNNCVFRLGQLVAGGAIDSGDAGGVLSELAQIAMGLPGDHPMTEREIRLTVKSGFEGGLQKPVSPDYKTDSLPALPSPPSALRSQNMESNVESQNGLSWFDRLQRTKAGKDGTPGAIKTNAFNLGLVLRNDGRFAKKFRFNELTQRVEVLEEDGSWRDVRDADFFLTAERVSEVYGMSSAPDTIATAISAIATAENAINPPAEYLGVLSWDGVERLNRVPSEILGADDREEYQNMFRWWMMAAVQRALTPGCKADSMLVLSGRAGIGKTTFFMELGLGVWAHSTSMMLDSKDFMQEVIGSWIVVFDEMSAFKKADHENAKAFITKTNDVFRTPYGRSMQTYPRRAIFAGTTNEEEFARESSGMRRFWPVECGTTADHIDIVKLREWRDQLWAEAVARVHRGEKAYASTPAECKALEALQAEIVISDAWQPAVVSWVQSRSVSEIQNGFTVSECLEGALKIEAAQQQHGAKCRVGLILRDCFNATSKRVGAKKLTKYFIPIESIAEDEVLRAKFGREEVLKLINASKLTLERFTQDTRVWLGSGQKSLPELKFGQLPTPFDDDTPNW